jgi:hypothetical protein
MGQVLRLSHYWILKEQASGRGHVEDAENPLTLAGADQATQARLLRRAAKPQHHDRACPVANRAR